MKDKGNNEFLLKPIGYVRTEAESSPRHWSASEVEGEIVINPELQPGLNGMKNGDKIVVIFGFHLSPRFASEHLLQKPPHRSEVLGVFNICSPVRPNPIGLSILEVVEISDNVIKVRRLDMYDGTPIFDIKPYIPYERTPSAQIFREKDKKDKEKRRPEKN